MKIIDKLINILKNHIEYEKIISVFIYGSINYGTYNKKSDYDVIIIYDQDEPMSETFTIDLEIPINYTLISLTEFYRMIKAHRIDALECLFLLDEFKFETVKFDFELNLDTLRRSISAVCSNSYVKCKKKMAQGDDYIGKKSLFHSLRIADYGIKLATIKRIELLSKYR